MSDKRITPSYLGEQRRLHADPRGYGARGDKWADTVASIAREMGPIDAILDYGCGQNTLAATLSGQGFRTRSYDPAIRAFDEEPKPADLVVCTDVLEHVEEECMVAVLSHLAQLCRRKLFVVISLVETSKTLSDGRQAHITLWPVEKWVKALDFAGFDLLHVIPNRPDKQFCAVFKRKKP